MTNDPADISRLRLLRLNNDWTVKDVARALGVSESTVRKAEQMYMSIDESTAKALAQLYHVKVEELFDADRIRPADSGGRRAGSGDREPSFEARRMLFRQLYERRLMAPLSPLEDERRKRGWSRPDVARKTGLSTATIQRAEQGSRVKPATARILAKLYGVEIDKLFTPEQIRPDHEGGRPPLTGGLYAAPPRRRRRT